MTEVEAGAAYVVGGLAQLEEEPVLSGRVGVGGEDAVGRTGDLPGARGHVQEVPRVRMGGSGTSTLARGTGEGFPGILG